MAVATVIERIGSLSKDDKNDLFELAKVIFDGESSQEDIDSAALAMTEIFDAPEASVEKVAGLTGPAESLKAWRDFVSKRIREERENAGMSQDELAGRTGLPQSHISRLETGKHSPAAGTITKIANAIGIERGKLDPAGNDS